MELFGILLGLIFWPIVIFVWFRLCRTGKVRGTRRRIGTALVLGLPTLAVLSTGWRIFVDEPLLSASAEGDVAKVKYLLAIGANVNVQDGSGVSALGMAVSRGHTEVVRVLLQQGADLNATVWYGSAMDGGPPQTLLSNAKAGGNQEIVTLLQKAGARK